MDLNCNATPGHEVALKKNTGKLYPKVNGFSETFDESLKDFKHSIENTKLKIGNKICPTDVLPENIQLLVDEFHLKYKFPKDFCLMYILFAVSVAVGNNYRAVVKRNWLEPAILYMAIVALAGQTKTPVQNEFTKVLKERNKKLYQEYSDALEKQEERKRLATKENPFNEAKVIRKQILIQDATLEATIKTLDNNSRGVGCLFDELTGFFGNLNRYSPSGNDMSFYLSAYNCQPYSTNRKTSEDIYLASPNVCIAGGIQPEPLRKTFSDDLQDNGGVSRFIYCYPENIKKEIPTDEEVDASLISHYSDTINYLMDKGDRELEKLKSFSKDEKYIEVPFNPEARELLFVHLQENADQVNEFNEEGKHRLASTFSKFDYHLIRLSFLMQLLQDASERQLTTEISIESVQKGIKLSDYFKWNALRVHSLISGNPLATIDEEKQEFYKELPDEEFALADALKTAKEIRAKHSEHVSDDATEKWAKRFLSTILFTKPKHGYYRKKKP